MDIEVCDEGSEISEKYGKKKRKEKNKISVSS